MVLYHNISDKTAGYVIVSGTFKVPESGAGAQPGLCHHRGLSIFQTALPTMHSPPEFDTL